MVTITNDDGSETEVFTAEELQAQKDAAIEEYKKANPDKTDELVLALEEVDKLKGKDMNFSALRKQKEEADQKVKDILAGVDDKMNTVKKEVLDNVMKDHYTDTLKSLVGDDKDLVAKVELQYKRLGDAAGTKAEVASKLRDAYLLATGNPESSNSGAFSSGGAGPIKSEPITSGKLTPEEKAMALEFASKGGMPLTAKDLENK